MHNPAFWHQVINTISEGFFMVDRQGRISQVNRALCELTGYSEYELVGKSCSIFQCDICAEMREGAVKNWCHLFANKQVTKRRCHIRHKNGSMIPVLKNARLMLCEEGDTEEGAGDEDVFSVETVTDISDIVQKDEYIHQVEKLLYPSAGFENMVGASMPMQRVFRLIEQAARSSAPVLITGDSGTGKELAAQAVHRLSPRRDFPFVELNCAALNEHVLESELFGHVKGAFTGALKDREGRFEAAHNGSLFLDEIGDIPLSMQVKILRVLETGVIQRVGSNRGQPVNVRIISATNRALPALIERGLFREDLAFRVNVIPVCLPSLRERRDDIPLLVNHFIKAMRELDGRRTLTVHPQLLQAFKAYSWPGNIRELRNILEHGAAMCGEDPMRLEHMPESFRVQNETTPFSPCADGREPGTIFGARAAEYAFPLVSERAARQKEEIIQALTAAHGNVSGAAKLLGIHRTTVINRMLRLGIRLHKTLAGVRYDDPGGFQNPDR